QPGRIGHEYSARFPRPLALRADLVVRSGRERLEPGSRLRDRRTAGARLMGIERAIDARNELVDALLGHEPPDMQAAVPQDSGAKRVERQLLGFYDRRAWGVRKHVRNGRRPGPRGRRAIELRKGVVTKTHETPLD